MNHRFFIIVIGLLTAAAIIGGLGSLEWKSIRTQQPPVAGT